VPVPRNSEREGQRGRTGEINALGPVWGMRVCRRKTPNRTEGCRKIRRALKHLKEREGRGSLQEGTDYIGGVGIGKSSREQTRRPSGDKTSGKGRGDH